MARKTAMSGVLSGGPDEIDREVSPGTGTFPGEADSTDSQLIEWIETQLASSDVNVTSFRDEAEKSDDFVNGHQWEEADLRRLKKSGRPSITFNRIASYTNTVIGTELQIRPGLRFVAREPNDVQRVKLSEFASEVYQWVLEGCHGDDERSQAFRDMVVTGMGWRELRIDIETDVDGKLIMERVPWDEMRWDPYAVKANVEDARWVTRQRWIPKRDVYAMFPDAKKKIMAHAPMGERSGATSAAGGIKVTRISPMLYTGTTKRISDPPNRSGRARTEDDSLVTEIQWWEREPVWRVASPTEENPRNILLLDEEEYKKLVKRSKGLGEEVSAARQYRRAYKRAIMADGVLLYRGDNVIPNGFSWLCITGIRDRKNNVWYGLVRNLLDPQRGLNAWFSQGMHVWQTSPKGALVVEEGAVVNPASVADVWGQPGSVLLLRDGAVSGKKYAVEQPPPFPEAASTMIQFAMESLGPIAGIDLATFMGKERATAEAGITNRQRIQQAHTILAPYFYAVLRSREDEAKRVMSFVREHLTDDRLIRVGGQYAAEMIPLSEDALAYEYDLIVDEQPNTPMMKQAAWDTMAPYLPMFQEQGGIPPEVLDLAPIPTLIREKIKERAQKKEQEAGAATPPEDPKMSPEYKEALVAKTNAETKLLETRATALDIESKIDALAKGQQAAHNAREQERLDGAHADKMASSTAKHALEATRDTMDRAGPLGGGGGVPKPAGGAPGGGAPGSSSAPGGAIPGTTLDEVGYNSRLADPGWPGNGG